MLFEQNASEMCGVYFQSIALLEPSLRENCSELLLRQSEIQMSDQYVQLAELEQKKPAGVRNTKTPPPPNQGQ